MKTENMSVTYIAALAKSVASNRRAAAPLRADTNAVAGEARQP
jgi:hypothetical protein